MNNKIGIIGLLVALAALGVALTKTPAPSTEISPKESAFERVMRTKTLRCAYLVNEPRMMIDPKTGERNGINVEVMEAIGKALHLKIDWIEEVGIGAYPENLKAGKEDVYCMTVWTSSARAHKVLLTNPIMYTPLYVFVRDGDTRFDDNLDVLNDSQYTIAVIDGTSLEAVAALSFPKAQRLALPAMSDGSDPLLALAAKKADAVVYNEHIVNRYNRNNPASPFRRVPSAGPLRTYGESFSVAMGEFELREMLNTAISELQNNGTLDAIITKYEASTGKFLRTRDPYVVQDK